MELLIRVKTDGKRMSGDDSLSSYIEPGEIVDMISGALENSDSIPFMGTASLADYESVISWLEEHGWEGTDLRPFFFPEGDCLSASMTFSSLSLW